MLSSCLATRSARAVLTRVVVYENLGQQRISDMSCEAIIHAMKCMYVISKCRDPFVSTREIDEHI